MSWTEDRIQQVKDYANAGLSCTEIAARVGGGLTRNSVIGKLHRLGIKKGLPHAPAEVREKYRPPKVPRDTTVSLAPISRRPAAAKPVPPPKPLLPPIPAVTATGGHLGITDLVQGKHCKWPIGDPVFEPESFHFCGAAPGEGKPYCEYHALRATQPMAARKKAPQPFRVGPAINARLQNIGGR